MLDRAPRIESLYDLSLRIRLSSQALLRLWKCNHLYYKRFEVEKRESDTKRVIEAPSQKMKAVQAWILRNILELVPLHQAATGFRKGLGLRANLERHAGNKFVYCIDIKDFFPSIQAPRIWSVFRNIGYNPHVSHILTKLCTVGDHLPQGGVTSPYLANIIAKRLDARVAGVIERRGISYSRYADDLVFSCNSRRLLGASVEIAKRIVKEEGFEVNARKSRLMGVGGRRMVTGLILYEDTFGVGRRRLRDLRKKLHLMHLVGLDQKARGELENYLTGWAAYLADVDRVRLEALVEYERRIVGEGTKVVMDLSRTSGRSQ